MTRLAGRNRSVVLPQRGRLGPEGHWLTCSGMIEAPSTLPAMPSLAAAAAAAAEGESMQQQQREQEEEEDEDSADGEWHEVVLLPREILRESPSQRLGVPEAVERRHRIFGCELIQEAGILLRQPQVVMATAQTLFHRFFYRRAFTSETAQNPPVPPPGKAPRAFLFDAFTAAMGCVFLASKLEEKPRAPRDVIFVFHHMCRRRRSLPPSLLEVTSSRYHDLREALLTTEKYVLKELGFGFYNVMDHPHKFILYYIKTLGGSPELAQRAWNYLNDSLRLDCCVRYRAELIACAALYMAARDLRVKLPDSPPWYGLFGASLAEIREVGNAILSLYHQQDEEGEEGPLRWLEPLHPFSLVAMEALGRVEGEGGEGEREAGGGKAMVAATNLTPGKRRSEGEGGRGEGGEDAAVTEEVEPTKRKKEKRERENGHDAKENEEEEGDQEMKKEEEESESEKKRQRKKRKKRQSRSRLSRSSSSSSSSPSSSTTAAAGVAAGDAAAGGERKPSKPLSLSRSSRGRSRSSSPLPAYKARSRSRGRERGREERRKHGGRSRTRSRSRSRERGDGGRERGRERERKREREGGREGRESGGGGGGRDYDDRREGASHHREGGREGGKDGGPRSRYAVERKGGGSGSGTLGGGYRDRERDRFRRDRARER